ncbi:MAG: hypothetical protein U0599_04775 [Vicinamibacteria bacterium]
MRHMLSLRLGWKSGAGAWALALALGTVGCAPDYVTNSTAPVNLLIAQINGGSVLDSDVRLSTGTICPDTVTVALAVRAKNQNSVQITVPQHVLVQQYEVRYYRTDGRGAEGVDVPYRYSGPIASEVDVDTGGVTSVPVQVVRRQAKLEPPLSNITGYQIVTMIAEITISGQTVAGESVTATGRMQIDFADFGDSLTACPTI